MDLDLDLHIYIPRPFTPDRVLCCASSHQSIKGRLNLARRTTNMIKRQQEILLDLDLDLE